MCSRTLTWLPVYANSVLAVYGEISLVSLRILTASVSLNSRRSIDNQFLDDFTSFSIGTLATNVPSARRPQTHGMDLESMVYNVPEVRDSVPVFQSS